MKTLTKYVSASLMAWALAACGAQPQLNLTISDPCTQSSLEMVEHIEIQVVGSEFRERQGTVWTAAAGRGELEDVPLISDAIVSVVGRTSMSDGAPGAAAIAGSVGLVDLTRSGALRLNIPVGQVGTFINTTLAVDGTCSQLAAPRREHTATLMDDGRVFLAGGFTADDTGAQTFWETTELYEPTSGDFINGPPVRWTRRGHTATKLPDGGVLLAGGMGLIGGSEEALAAAQIYDPETNRFRPALQFNQPRAYHTATKLEDGRVVLVGGRGASGQTLASTEILSPSTGSIKQGPPLSNARAYHAAVLVAPKVIAVLGGQRGGQGVDSVEFIDLNTMERVIPGPTLSVPRSHLAAEMVDDTTLAVMGGFGDGMTSFETASGLGDVDLLTINLTDLAQSSVACSGPFLRDARGDAGLARVPGGLLLVGGVSSGGSLLDTAEILRVRDLETCDLFMEGTAGGSGVARGGAELTSLMGGDVLVTGGYRDTGTRLTGVGVTEVFIRER